MTFDPFSLMKIVKYATTDQEQEGREAGIKTAASIYAPILRKLEIQQSQILTDLDNEQADFEEKVNFIRERCSTFEKGISDATMTINSMRGQSEHMDNLIENMSINGMPCTLSIPTILSIFLNFGIGNYLDEKMEKKWLKYYQIEFENQSREWQKKITKITIDIDGLIEDLLNIQESNQEQLQRITRIFNETISRYCEKSAQLNLLQLVGSRNGQS